ncbi:MAG: urease accessory protein UreF [Methylobacteriaceae bacterium]|nr:urease accessory protein UreF [Methylobacteriaceae bacterium]MBV9245644.1 urease accessory protein UreF [Methylobacteriaceae bacterium]
MALPPDETSSRPSLLPLLVWTSPAFPVGAYAYSHGLEWSVESGAVRDAASLRQWLVDLLEHGAPRNDAILLAQAWRAAAALDEAALREVNALALALASSRERRLETSAQGNAFVSAAQAAWPCAALDCLSRNAAGDVAYPVAFGAAAGGHGVDLTEASEAYCLAFIANLVSTAVRLGVLGQTDGQRTTAALLPRIRSLAAFTATAAIEDLGTAAFQSDLAALQHETQYSRLFRS